VKVLERYWWPAIVLIYPLANIFWLFPIFKPFGGNSPRHLLTLIALIGGALFEWSAHPELRLSDMRYLPRALWKHPILVAGFALAVWVVLSALVSDAPAVALTGSLVDGSDSAISYLALVGLMTFSYLYYQRKAEEKTILFDCIISSAIILAILALYEVITQNSIMFGPSDPMNLPIVTFNGNGHLAGYFVLVFGGVLSMWFKRDWKVLPVMILLILAMSVSANRTSIIAAFVATLLGWRTPKLLLVAMAIVIGGYFGGNEILKFTQAGNIREFAIKNNGETRQYLWKAAVMGIASRPLTGFGGPLFVREWYKFLTLNDLKAELMAEYKYKLNKIYDKAKEDIIFDVIKSDGKQTLARISALKVHNQILDVGLMWGVIGLIFYLILIVFGLKNLNYPNFSSFGIFAYIVFSMTWFIANQVHGIVFILIALSQKQKDP
jgi:O-antigen ligase